MESLPSSPPKSAPVQSRRSYRSLPIHEPFKPKSREAECDFVLDKAWPKSSLQPRRRLPQTSSLLWRRKPHHKSSAEFFTNESRLSELKCISQHDDIFLNTHLSSSDPLLDSAVPYTLPDRSTVLVSSGLEGLLRQLVERRMVQTVLKYVPSEESGGAFRYVFGLKQVKRPIRKVEDCPLDIRTLVISPTRAITLEKAAFDPVHNSIIPSNFLNSHSFLPISALFQKNSTITKLTHKASFPSHQPQPVSTAVLGRVDMPPFQADVVLREALKKPKSIVRSAYLWSARVVEHSGMVVTARPSLLSAPKEKAEFTHLNGGKLIEGNAGFRRPHPSPIPTLTTSHSSRTLPRAISLTGSSQGFKAEVKGKRTLLKLSDSLLKQLDVASFCARYSLTEKEFAKLVEEFVVLAAGGEGVRADVLCGHYRVEKEALKGLNSAFNGVLLPWSDFVSFYSLAISQRSQLSDLLAYLLTVSDMQYTSISSLYHLTVDYMMEALRMRLSASRMTETVKRIWSALCVCLVGEREVICAGEKGRIDVETAVEAAGRGEVSVLDLRYLVAELFQAPS